MAQDLYRKYFHTPGGDLHAGMILFYSNSEEKNLVENFPVDRYKIFQSLSLLQCMNITNLIRYVNRISISRNSWKILISVNHINLDVPDNF